MALKTNYKIGDDYTADVHNEENTQINQNTTDIASLQSGLKATNANVESNTEDIETNKSNIASNTQWIEDIGLYVVDGMLCVSYEEGN